MIINMARGTAQGGLMQGVWRMVYTSVMTNAHGEKLISMTQEGRRNG